MWTLPGLLALRWASRPVPRLREARPTPSATSPVHGGRQNFAPWPVQDRYALLPWTVPHHPACSCAPPAGSVSGPGNRRTPGTQAGVQGAAGKQPASTGLNLREHQWSRHGSDEHGDGGARYHRRGEHGCCPCHPVCHRKGTGLSSLDCFGGRRKRELIVPFRWQTGWQGQRPCSPRRW